MSNKFEQSKQTSPEQFNTYSKEEALDEAHKIQRRTNNFLRIGYSEAEQDLENSIRSLIKDVASTSEKGESEIGRGSYFKSREEITKYWGISESILSNPTGQEFIKQGFSDALLSSSRIDEAMRIKEYFNLSEESVSQIVKQKIIDLLTYGNIDQVKKIKEVLNPSKEIFSNPEVQVAAKKGIMYSLSNGLIFHVKETKEFFNFPDELFSSPEAQILAEKGLADSLLRYRHFDKEYPLVFKDTCHFTEDILSRPAIQAGIQKGIFEMSSVGMIDDAVMVINAFKVPLEEIYHLFEQQIAVEELAKDNQKAAAKYRETLSLLKAKLSESM